MTAISKSWVTIADTAVDPDSPIDSTLMFGIRDDLVHVREWLGASYTAGAVQDHNHDGLNSAKLQIGPNMLRNGDFESGLTGWTATQYTGGTIATYTGNADGAAGVQIASTVLANGGGDILSNEFMTCVGGSSYFWSCNNWVAGSVANVSSKLEAVFYDATQTHISDSLLFSYNSTPTANTRVSGTVLVPDNARYMKIRATGGIPATPVGGNVGTVYFDAIYVSFGASRMTVYTQPGTYTFVMPTDFVNVRVQGAGGAADSGGYAGASGAYGEMLVNAKKGTSVTVTVGAGGVFSAGTGGTSSFGAWLSCTGGVGSGSGGTVSPSGAIAIGKPLYVALNGAAGPGLYQGGAAAFLSNTGAPYGGVINATYGGGGANGGGTAPRIGYGGDGFVTVEW